MTPSTPPTRWPAGPALAAWLCWTPRLPGTRVLELGCGTGAEAIHLAGRGVHVVATDAAPAMIAALAAKLAPGGPAAPLAGGITPLVLPAGRAGDLVDRYGRGAFDGAYSSFGPLNCEPNIAPVAAALAALVRPGGRVVLSLLINRYCLWETAWYLRAGQSGPAFRRWPGRAAATVRGAWQEERITIFYWTPGAVERVFHHFAPGAAWACPGCCRRNTSTAWSAALPACSAAWPAGTAAWPAIGPATPWATISCWNWYGAGTHRTTDNGR